MVNFVLKKKLLAIILFTLSITVLQQSTALAWTRRNTKVFTAGFDKVLQKKSSILISSLVEGWDVGNFSQLIFSWNAQKPLRGFFKFQARVRDQKTKKWLSWHTLAVWGAKTKKSFTSKHKGSEHHFVRLERETTKDFLAKKADAFEIKIEARSGASLKDLKAFTTTTSSLARLQPESSNCFNRLPTIYLKGVPALSQWQIDHPENHRLCSPTSVSMIVGYLINKQVNPARLAQEVYDEGLEAYGSWPFNMAHAFESVAQRYFFFVTRLKSFTELHAILNKNIPVAVSVRGVLDNAPKPYLHGHLLVVVGYNARKKQVLCHDPAQPNNKQVPTIYSLDSFLKAWERSHRLAYVAEKRFEKKGSI